MSSSVGNVMTAPGFWFSHREDWCAPNDGNAAYCEVMVEDITERRALEEQVRQSQKMDAIALLAGGTSHDFNTLLTGILGYAELLLIGSDLADSERRKVEAIVAAAVQARAITQQLLTLGRRQPLKTKVINVSALVVDLEDFLRRMAGATYGVAHGPGGMSEA